MQRCDDLVQDFKTEKYRFIYGENMRPCCKTAVCLSVRIFASVLLSNIGRSFGLKARMQKHANVFRPSFIVVSIAMSYFIVAILLFFQLQWHLRRRDAQVTNKLQRKIATVLYQSKSNKTADDSCLTCVSLDSWRFIELNWQSERESNIIIVFGVSQSSRCSFEARERTLRAPSTTTRVVRHLPAMPVALELTLMSLSSSGTLDCLLFIVAAQLRLVRFS